MTKTNELVSTKSRAAEFFGHCQACGHLQKLPKGKLSLHGYTTRFGFFSGICGGAKELPFEKSCDLVKLYIEKAKTQLASVEAFQAELRTPVTEPKAYFRASTSVKGDRYGKNRTRSWKVCDITVEFVPFRDAKTPEDGYNKFYRNGDVITERKWNEETKTVDTLVEQEKTEVSAEFRATLLDVANKANGVYADWLEHEAENLRRYIVWQTERVNSWKEADLLPVKPKGKDKTAFVPTEPKW